MSTRSFVKDTHISCISIQTIHTARRVVNHDLVLFPIKLVDYGFLVEKLYITKITQTFSEPHLKVRC